MTLALWATATFRVREVPRRESITLPGTAASDINTYKPPVSLCDAETFFFLLRRSS
jgi:hypothetical protein